ncbi:MAG: DUF1501 domain-containing protein [Bradymonadaceae bacterium]|nr:DUF1501 domain-containing protein [Lujinxingiaceae bacterium]
MSDDKKTPSNFNRRSFLKGVGAVAASVAVPHIWIPNQALASSATRGAIKHLIYVRLSGGFRFTTAFNSDVAAEFNPFGVADKVASGTEWGACKLLEQASWLEGDGGRTRAALGMKPVTEISNQIAVLPCVDHEPLAARADGNHQTGLERYLTGYVSGATSFLTMINYGLRERYQLARAENRVVLPAFTLDDAAMAIGGGEYAAHRPPVMQGDGFDRFGFSAGQTLPEWAQKMSANVDERMRDRQHPRVRAPVDAYMQTRDATEQYADVFNHEALKVRNNSDAMIDGISNRQLADIFGDDRVGRNIRLSLRLFHFGCPAVYFNQGGYDMHSGEEAGLPRQIDHLNRLISGLEVALKRMTHADGGSYWDHTMIVFGSEFGRTARGSRFNSARGSDHAGDNATRWMSMPFMGGLVEANGMGGRQLGETKRADLKPAGEVYSYRSVLKTLMDGLGCDHREFFPADRPFDALLG